jgi:hypothetical protein
VSSLVRIILLISFLPTMLCNMIGCAEEIVIEGGPSKMKPVMSLILIFGFLRVLVVSGAVISSDSLLCPS